MSVRCDFSINSVYLDSAATTLTPTVVAASYADNFYNSADKAHRKRIADFLGVEKEQIKFTRGATNSLNLIAQHYKSRYSKVSLPIRAHHSNLLPWQRDYKLDYEMNGNEILAIDHVSNVLGSINKIDRADHKVVVVDGSQAPSHMKLDLSKIDCDFYTFSSHKMYGPTGLGILYDKNNLIEEPPINNRAVISFCRALDYFEEHFHLLQKEYELLKRGTQELKSLGAKIYGNCELKVPIISFGINNVHPHDIAGFLSEKNIAVRAGNHCAQPLMKDLGVNATTRVSFGIYSNDHDLDLFIKELKRAISFFD